MSITGDCSWGKAFSVLLVFLFFPFLSPSIFSHLALANGNDWGDLEALTTVTSFCPISITTILLIAIHLKPLSFSTLYLNSTEIKASAHHKFASTPVALDDSVLIYALFVLQ